MRILLLCMDLFKTIGGGQTVYRKIIENSPEANFYYFIVHEAPDAPRPANAKVLRIPMVRGELIEPTDPLKPSYRRLALNRAALFAAAAAETGQTFDIVESPDYEIYGSFLRAALAHYRVKWGRTVLALHGNISTSVRLNWNPSPVADLEDMEIRQFREADGVYGLSRFYLREWAARGGERDMEYLDPRHFINWPLATPPYNPDWSARPGERPDRRPDLCCVGRLERRKGFDLFLELARWLPSEAYNRLLAIGSDERVSNFGLPASAALQDLAAARGLRPLEYIGPLPTERLAEVYAGRNVVVLPVRYDSFNLVALEAVAAGCPLAVSDRAGVCAFLDEEFPGLPYLKIDMDNLYGCLEELRATLFDYEARRAALAAWLAAHKPAPLPRLDMPALYGRILDSAPNPAATAQAPFLEWSMPQDTTAFRALAPPVLKSRAKTLGAAVLRRAEKLFSSKYGILSRKALTKLQSLLSRPLGAALLLGQLRSYRQLPEGGRRELEAKLARLYSLAEIAPLNRAMFWRELARLEDRRRNPLFSAVYKLRVMRALGGDSFGLLPGCLESLRELGMAETAEAARALYAAGEEAAVYNFLAAARARQASAADKPYEILDDRRPAAARPLVSIIVSLYQAEDKLEFFLTALAEQTLLRGGRAEIIIQDSASPQNERAVLERFRSARPRLEIVYGRSPQRETIQAAWNRGVKLARAPYLVFLGVDEGLYPEALEKLAAELDANPDVDWVMGDSLVVETGARGLYERDVMAYDRLGGTKDHVYLETCYLSWVGGMYRRNLHERFGFYDETFRAAGDTEFKNRILPGLKVKYLTGRLGVFFNYPEERTTASPLAEIEDTRAWYIHRSLGGVRYAFENRPLEEVKAQLERALGYRKSYCGHISSDFDYALALARHGAARGDGPFWKVMEADVARLRDSLAALEWAGEGAGALWLRAVAAVRQLRRLRRKHAALLSRSPESLGYTLFQDNRHEQHSWLWKSLKTKGDS